MTNTEAKEFALCYEVLKEQSAWKMVQDGYKGDFKAYFKDYKDDLETEKTDFGYIITNIVSGSKYEIRDGFISDIQ